jgi:murein DD-endopeptidase MepM/ murein hydrolase activator NlpD
MFRKISSALLILLVLLVVSYSSVFAQQGPVYIVQQGDTLTSIAEKFGTSVEELVDVNQISDPSLIQPGDELVIPGFEGVEGILTLQEVGFGETLSSLSFRYGIELDDLARLNRVVNPGRIFAGQSLILPIAAEESAISPRASILLAQAGESKLQGAVKNSLNPWQIHSGYGNEFRLWTVPGSLLVVLGGDQTPQALPEPILGVDLDPFPVIQGKTTKVSVSLNQSAQVEGQLGGHTLNFFELEASNKIALQGIHAMAEPGIYDFTLRLFSTPEGELLYAYIQPVRIQDGFYGFESINGVPQDTIDPTITEPEQEMVEEQLSIATPDRLWGSTFDYPSDYYTDEFLSIFGTRRSYNWGAYYYYHTGLDFYGGTGVEILAPAGGKVVYTGSLVVRGNVTYIDHGWGVYSGYFHQSEIFVSEGDMVERGQVIGLVGGTGRSTGPHLHWEIWVGGVPVDPLDWVQGGFP